MIDFAPARVLCSNSFRPHVNAYNLIQDLSPSFHSGPIPVLHLLALPLSTWRLYRRHFLSHLRHQDTHLSSCRQGRRNVVLFVHDLRPCTCRYCPNLGVNRSRHSLYPYYLLTQYPHRHPSPRNQHKHRKRVFNLPQLGAADLPLQLPLHPHLALLQFEPFYREPPILRSISH